MKIYFVQKSDHLVNGVGYTKMSDARNLQKQLREEEPTKLGKASIKVQTIEVTL